jgi:hypothetical protein
MWKITRQALSCDGGFLQARGWRPRKPAAHISRQTRLGPTRTPRVTSSAWVN